MPRIEIQMMEKYQRPIIKSKAMKEPRKGAPFLRPKIFGPRSPIHNIIFSSFSSQLLACSQNIFLPTTISNVSKLRAA